MSVCPHCQKTFKNVELHHTKSHAVFKMTHIGRGHVELFKDGVSQGKFNNGWDEERFLDDRYDKGDGFKPTYVGVRLVSRGDTRIVWHYWQKSKSGNDYEGGSYGKVAFDNYIVARIFKK